MGLNIRTVEIIDSPNFYKNVPKPVARKTNPSENLGQSSKSNSTVEKKVPIYKKSITINFDKL